MSLETIEIINCHFSEAVASIQKPHNIQSCLSDQEAQGIIQYFETLKQWNKKIDLVSPQSDEMLIGKHFVDSAIVSCFIKDSFDVGESSCYLDVGSGAGFPGAVMALFEPSRKTYLIEPREKRCVFLREIKRQLKLANVEVVCSRVEDFRVPAEKVGLITNRALGMREDFLTEAGRLLDSAGYVVELLTPEQRTKKDIPPGAMSLSYILPPDKSERIVLGYRLKAYE